MPVKLPKLADADATSLPPSPPSTAANAQPRPPPPLQHPAATADASPRLKHLKGVPADADDAPQREAATKMQAVQRGKSARKSAQGKKIGKGLGLTGSEEEAAAAAKIQAVNRGKAARREMGQQQEAATKMQARHQGKAARKAAVVHAGITDAQWFCSLFRPTAAAPAHARGSATTDSASPAAAIQKAQIDLVEAVAAMVKCAANAKSGAVSVAKSLHSVDRAELTQLWRDEDMSTTVGEYVLQLILSSTDEQQILEREVAGLCCRSKGAEEFKFGSAEDFSSGLVGMIGLPTGLTERQWLASIESEHCQVDAGDSRENPKAPTPHSAIWGASFLPWTTGNYNLKTAPAYEYWWVLRGEWAGVVASKAPGGMSANPETGEYDIEDRHLARRAVSIARMCAAAPQRCFDMLKALAKDGVLSFEMGRVAFQTAWAALKVNRAEIMCTRLYTGPMFEFYNTVLREQGGTLPSSDRRYPSGPGQTDGATAGRFVTTIHVVNSCILKLSQLTPVATVYRGTSGHNMPDALLRSDAFGSKLGIEFGLMSTSTSKAVAQHYSQDQDETPGLCYLLEIQMDGLNRGAMISFLSQYSGECEVLFGPLTGLEVMQAGWVRGATKHLQLRPTVNQLHRPIEQLVAQRKVLHVEAVKNLHTELKGGEHPAPPQVLEQFERHLLCVASTNPAVFNDDALYKAVVFASVELKGTLAAVAAAFRGCCEHLDSDEVSRTAEEARLLRYLAGDVNLLPLLLPSLPTPPEIEDSVLTLGVVRRRAAATAAAAADWQGLDRNSVVDKLGELIESLAVATVPFSFRPGRSRPKSHGSILVSLIELGAGGCLRALLGVESSALQSILKLRDTAATKGIVHSDDRSLLAIPSTPDVATVVQAFLIPTGVRSVGRIAFDAMCVKHIVTEMNLTGRTISACEAGLVARSVGHGLQSVQLSPKLAIDESMMSASLLVLDLSGKVEPNDLLMISTIFSFTTSLSDLVINSCNLSGSAVANMGRYSARLVEADVECSGLHMLVEAIACSKAISSVSFKSCYLGPKALQHIARLVATCHTLTSLVLDGNPLFGEIENWGEATASDKFAGECSPFFEALADSNVSALSLVGTGAGPKVMSTFAASIGTSDQKYSRLQHRSSTPLVTVNLSSNPITGAKMKEGARTIWDTTTLDSDIEGFTALCSALASSSVTDLSISRCQIGPKAIGAFSACVGSGLWLRSLSVSKNSEILDEAMVQLLDALKVTSLTKLDIADCNIGSTSASKLAEVLSVEHALRVSLEELDLSTSIYNRQTIGLEGAATLGAALLESNLHVLTLGAMETKLQLDGVDAIDLSGQQLQHADLVLVSPVIGSVKALKCLDVSENKMAGMRPDQPKGVLFEGACWGDASMRFFLDKCEPGPIEAVGHHKNGTFTMAGLWESDGTVSLVATRDVGEYSMSLRWDVERSVLVGEAQNNADQVVFQMKETPLDTLRKTLEHSTTLTRLGVRNIGLGPATLGQLSSLLPQMATLIALDLSLNPVTGTQFKQTGDQADQAEEGTAILDTVDTDLGGLVSCCEAIQASSISNLDMSGCHIGPVGVSILTKAVPLWFGLNEITVSSTGDMRSQQSFTLMGLQEGCTQTLELADSGIGPADLQFLGAVFASFARFGAKLKEVDLSTNPISSSESEEKWMAGPRDFTGLYAMCTELPSTVSTLLLENCQLEPKTVKVLAQLAPDVTVGHGAYVDEDPCQPASDLDPTQNGQLKHRPLYRETERMISRSHDYEEMAKNAEQVVKQSEQNARMNSQNWSPVEGHLYHHSGGMTYGNLSIVEAFPAVVEAQDQQAISRLASARDVLNNPHSLQERAVLQEQQERDAIDAKHSRLALDGPRKHRAEKQLELVRRAGRADVYRAYSTASPSQVVEVEQWLQDFGPVGGASEPVYSDEVGVLEGPGAVELMHLVKGRQGEDMTRDFEVAGASAHFGSSKLRKLQSDGNEANNSQQIARFKSQDSPLAAMNSAPKPKRLEPFKYPLPNPDSRQRNRTAFKLGVSEPDVPLTREQLFPELLLLHETELYEGSKGDGGWARIVLTAFDPGTGTYSAEVIALGAGSNGGQQWPAVHPYNVQRWAAGPSSLTAKEVEVGRTGLYEAKGTGGKWWPVKLTKKRSSVTFAATIEYTRQDKSRLKNRLQTNWPSVNIESIRARLPKTAVELQEHRRVSAAHEITAAAPDGLSNLQPANSPTADLGVYSEATDRFAPMVYPRPHRSPIVASLDGEARLDLLAWKAAREEKLAAGPFLRSDIGSYASGLDGTAVLLA